MKRRRLVGAVAAGTLAALAGCSAGGDGRSTTTADDGVGSPAPPADAAPRDLLPEPPDGWELHDTREVGVGLDAEAGVQATFTPDGSIGYQVYVYRFESVAAAREAAAAIAEEASTAAANDRAYVFRVAVRTGNFVVGGSHGGGTDDRLVELLARIEGLSASAVEDGTLV